MKCTWIAGSSMRSRRMIIERIGPTVYAKGHLKKYAALLGLPAAEILAGFESRAPASRAASPGGRPEHAAAVARRFAVIRPHLPLVPIGACVAAALAARRSVVEALARTRSGKRVAARPRRAQAPPAAAAQPEPGAKPVESGLGLAVATAAPASTTAPRPASAPSRADSAHRRGARAADAPMHRCPAPATRACA